MSFIPRSHVSTPLAVARWRLIMQEKSRKKGQAMNKIIVIGHLGRDPEMRYLPSGQGVSNFSIPNFRDAVVVER